METNAGRGAGNSGLLLGTQIQIENLRKGELLV